MKDVQGKTALITGGAMGMGKLWAEHFADDGANLVLWDINGEALEDAAAGLRARGVDVMTQIVDVSDRRQVYQAAVKVLAETGGVDILVNNAAIVFSKPFLETPDEHLAATVDVDLKALFWTMKAFLPRMLENDSGHIINISSASGFIGIPRLPAYVASKWGVIGLTESVRLEVREQGKEGVGFTLFCPSLVDTGMFEGARAPLLSPMLSPEAAVRIAYDGFRDGKYMITAPWMVGITPAIKSLLPSKLFDLVSDVFGVSKSMVDLKGKEERR